MTILTAIWTSFCENEAGYLIGPAKGLGTGMTSEQSVRFFRSWPRSCNLDIAARNLEVIDCWSSIGVATVLSECNAFPVAKSNEKHTDHGLPGTGSPGILRDCKVALETHFTCYWGEDFTRLGAVAWPQRALEKDLKEDLGVTILVC